MMLVWALLACGGKSTVDTEVVADTEVPYTPPGAGEVTLTTLDHVALVADSYPAATEDRLGIVLLHMNPVSFDRTDWPAEFIALLHGHDWNVIVPDRRGAGESGGVATDAAETELGRYDVEASVRYLREAAHAGKIVVLGASNGTTSAVDYTVHAAAEGWPAPAGLGFLTGGSYTENNNPITSIGAVPSVFTFSTDEREWSVAQQGAHDDVWAFHEYADGDHGTRMFDAAPEVAATLDSWVLSLE